MHKIRESCDPNFEYPSSLFFGSDLPENSVMLFDDITEHVFIRRSKMDYIGQMVDIFTYDEYTRGLCGKVDLAGGKI